MAVNQENRKNMMLTEPMTTLIPKMALPTIVSFLISSVYSLADTYFVSGLGTNATAAVSVNSSLDMFINMAGTLFAVGASSYISRLLGAGNEKRANQVLSTAFYFTLAFGLLVFAVGIIWMTPMVRLLGATPTCEQFSIDYATYVLLVAPFMATSFVMNQGLRAEGSAMLSMIGMGFGGILNCFLDPLFIITLGLGVKGASIATAISKLVSFSILLFPYLTGRSVLRFSIRNVRFEGKMLYEIVSVGSPSMFRTALSVLSGIVINNIAGGISDACLAAIGVSNKIMMFPFSVALGLGGGFQPVAGFNWGAKRYDRVRESYRFTVKLGLVIAVVMGGLIAVFADKLILLFSESDPELRRIGALCIRLQCAALPVHIEVAIINMYCAGLGFALRAFLLATSRQGSCFLPIVFVMAKLWGSNGVASVQAAADLLSLLLAVPVLISVFRAIGRAERELQGEQIQPPSLESE